MARRCRLFRMRRISCSAANWNTPSDPTERDSGELFALRIFCRLRKQGNGELLEDDAMIAPGVEVIRVPGHNADMQCVRLSGGGEDGVFLCGFGAYDGASAVCLDHGF